MGYAHKIILFLKKGVVVMIFYDKKWKVLPAIIYLAIIVVGFIIGVLI